ncbi:hypothetical protein ACIO93_00360 [Streptomyces sp. NPDC087903]|uniref:hypothetical protein n=1 Tax=Streptomyces sp. NPDC087903 TaxID=3365819 RepID=UPI0037F6D8C6
MSTQLPIHQTTTAVGSNGELAEWGQVGSSSHGSSAACNVRAVARAAAEWPVHFAAFDAFVEALPEENAQ